MPAVENPSAGGAGPPAARELLFVVLGALAAMTALAWWILQPATMPSRVTEPAANDSPSEYVGSRTCAPCHPGEYAAHARSGHARTLRPMVRTALAKQLDGITVDDPEEPSVTWHYAFGDGAPSVERREGRTTKRLLIDYAFGSGHHATTFATITARTPEGPAMIENRLTVFAHKTLPDITPGQAPGGNPKGLDSLGRHFGPEDTLQCFRCHSTVTSDHGSRRLDLATMIPNVGCERCHGPGRSHVEAAHRGAAESALGMQFSGERKPGASDEELRLCGSCHRLPEMGDPGLIRTDNPVLVRFQPVGLMQSACYRSSRGALTCLTCHDAHARTSTDGAAYEAVCLSCHEGPSQRPCTVSPATGCVGCHMPRRDVARGMMMTDHWIRTEPGTRSSPLSTRTRTKAAAAIEHGRLEPLAAGQPQMSE
jgi:hypothetical protein